MELSHFIPKLQYKSPCGALAWLFVHTGTFSFTFDLMMTRGRQSLSFPPTYIGPSVHKCRRKKVPVVKGRKKRNAKARAMSQAKARKTAANTEAARAAARQPVPERVALTVCGEQSGGQVEAACREAHLLARGRLSGGGLALQPG
jgi:hypothetical protein